MDVLTSTDPQLADRLDRERAYHDQRFAEETRLAQRKYYWAVRDAFSAYEQRRTQLAQGGDVLEYGCAKGAVSLSLAPTAKSVTGIDISPVAIGSANDAAAAQGLLNTRFDVMNAEAMEFEDESFDFIFGSGIIHHLDVKRSYRELHRVLRPGGRVLFIEPLGHNPVLGLYRKMTPAARTEDEHPLRKGDIRAFGEIFGDLRTHHFGLFSLGAVPFRNTAAGPAAYGASRALDRAVFALPFAKWWSWFCVMEGRKAD